MGKPIRPFIDLFVCKPLAFKNHTIPLRADSRSNTQEISRVHVVNPLI
jgi:hypothetical protein